MHPDTLIVLASIWVVSGWMVAAIHTPVWWWKKNPVAGFFAILLVGGVIGGPIIGVVRALTKYHTRTERM